MSEKPSEVHSTRPYEYAGLPLVPTSMAVIVQRLYAPGAVVRRDQMIDDVIAYHQQRGGKLSSVDPVSQMKKALGDLQASGSVEQTGVYGYWRLLQSGDTDLPFQEEEFEIPVTEDSDESSQFEVHHITGDGNGSVYAYYFPAYFKNDSAFPIKIGMSAGSYSRRITEQLGTSNPELPVIYRVIKTEQPRLIERFLHSALTLRGNHLDDAPGQEWFLTRPEAIDELLRLVGILDSVPQQVGLEPLGSEPPASNSPSATEAPL